MTTEEEKSAAIAEAKLVDIPSEQRENLVKLATYLLGKPKLLGRKRAKFDMATYSEYSFDEKDTCGSVGCAIGHGPYAGIPKHSNEDWMDYGERAFYPTTEVYSYMFYQGWANIDNTPLGAAKRILFFLKYGLPPSWCDESYKLFTINELR